MDFSFKPPPALIFDQNLSKNYEKFKQRFEIYLRAINIDDTEDERKVAILLNVGGEEMFDVFNTLKLTTEQKKKYKEVIKAFDEYCKPRNNETYDRFRFFTRSQKTDEGFDHFIKDLKILAKSCNFGDQEESLIRDRIILGITDLSLQEKLLGTTNLKLNKAEELCRASEASKIQVKGLQGEEVHAIKYSTETMRVQVSIIMTVSNVEENIKEVIVWRLVKSAIIVEV